LYVNEFISATTNAPFVGPKTIPINQG